MDILNKTKPYRNVFRLLKYVCKFAPEVVVMKSIMMFIDIGLNYGFNVALIKIILDAIANKVDFHEVLFSIIGYSILLLLSIIMETVYGDYIFEKGMKKVHKGMHTLVFKKVQQIDLIKYDDTGFYNDYIWALEKCDNQTISSFQNFMKLLTSILLCTSYIALIIHVDKVLLIFIIVPIVTNVLVGSWLNKILYKFDIENNLVERREKYFKRVFYLKQYAKDLKSTGINDVLLNDFDETINQEISILQKYKNKIISLNLFMGSGTDVIQVSILYIYLAFQAIVKGAYTVGTCASMINTVNQLSSSINQVFSIVPRLHKNGIYAEKLFLLLDSQSEIETLITDKEILAFEELELKNVSFSYENSESNALTNVTMKIKKGDKVAIVGYNGAGKSTLIHLILHFYNPKSGSIIYNGTDLRQLTTKEYRKKFGVIFQDFQIYAMSLLDNIIMEKIDSEKHEHYKKLGKKCLEISKLEEYKDKLEKMMTKEFDNEGLELSGGQKQKVAIARAFAKEHDLIIMDEASSSLDPISEKEINEAILNEGKEKTMIIISHRLATIRYVDRIYFFDHGKIIEQGTHDELISLNGKYADMYEAQAENYRNQ